MSLPYDTSQKFQVGKDFTLAFSINSGNSAGHALETDKITIVAQKYVQFSGAKTDPDKLNVTNSTYLTRKCEEKDFQRAPSYAFKRYQTKFNGNLYCIQDKEDDPLFVQNRGFNHDRDMFTTYFILYVYRCNQTQQAEMKTGVTCASSNAIDAWTQGKGIVPFTFTQKMNNRHSMATIPIRRDQKTISIYELEGSRIEIQDSHWGSLPILESKHEFEFSNVKQRSLNVFPKSPSAMQEDDLLGKIIFVNTNIRMLYTYNVQTYFGELGVAMGLIQPLYDLLSFLLGGY